MSSSFEIKSRIKVSHGHLVRFSHLSRETKTVMTSAVFLPKDSELEGAKFPCVMYLSGLTCNDENVCQKGGVFQALAEHKVCIFIFWVQAYILLLKLCTYPARIYCSRYFSSWS
jgi:S-formylglutathione hydrolase FrmB